MTCSVKFFEPTTTTSPAGRANRLTAVARTTTAATPSALRPAARDVTGARRSRASSRASRPSAASASPAAGTAPARMVVVSTIDRPRKMYSPRPPAPTAAAMVVVPTPITVATRMPETMAGSASGSCTSRSNCPSVMPMATPASTTAGSTVRMPVTVMRMTGSSA